MIVLQQIKLITRPLNPSFNMHVKGLENFQRHWRSRHPPRPIPRAGDGATSALTGPFLTVGEANKPGALMVFQRMPISLHTLNSRPQAFGAIGSAILINQRGGRKERNLLHVEYKGKSRVRSTLICLHKRVFNPTVFLKISHIMHHVPVAGYTQPLPPIL